MARCDSDSCPRPDDPVRGIDHYFSGYAFYAQFHPGCCPGSLDGLNCDGEHPGGWAPAEPDIYERIAEEDARRRDEQRACPECDPMEGLCERHWELRYDY